MGARGSSESRVAYAYVFMTFRAELLSFPSFFQRVSDNVAG